jgi:cell fate regulator YaaT (PSP1 superfamily)
MSAGPPGAVVTVKTIPGGRIRAAVVAGPEPPFADGEPVILQTDGGAAIARVVAGPLALVERQTATDHTPRLVRRATQQDQYLRQRHEQREREAFRIGVMKIRERGLAMKLTRVEQLFDGSRLVFYFTAEDRVDFRELVRELASDFKTRIELRQIGVRDEARMLTGYGTCGRPLCCASWLKSFDPVSIRMAKQQDLALNPSRLSGLCGRLKCCLRFELAPAAAASAAAVAAHDETFAGSDGETPPPAGACGGCGKGCGS